MGVLEDLETRVTAMENRWDEHDTVHAGIDRKLDLLVTRADHQAIRTDELMVRTDELMVRTDELMVRTDELMIRTNELMVRTDDLPVIRASQIEMRDMLAKLLARDERRRDS